MEQLVVSPEVWDGMRVVCSPQTPHNPLQEEKEVTFLRSLILRPQTSCSLPKKPTTFNKSSFASQQQNEEPGAFLIVSASLILLLNSSDLTVLTIFTQRRQNSFPHRYAGLKDLTERIIINKAIFFSLLASSIQFYKALSIPLTPQTPLIHLTFDSKSVNNEFLT